MHVPLYRTDSPDCGLLRSGNAWFAHLLQLQSRRITNSVSVMSHRMSLPSQSVRHGYVGGMRLTCQGKGASRDARSNWVDLILILTELFAQTDDPHTIHRRRTGTRVAFVLPILCCGEKFISVSRISVLVERLKFQMGSELGGCGVVMVTTGMPNPFGFWRFTAVTTGGNVTLICGSYIFQVYRVASDISMNY